jgi:hypothetical protein
MNQKIEAYITKHYYELANIAKKLTKNHDLSDDLFHEILIQLYEKDKIILKRYDDDSIRYYIVAIMRINWYSKTSPFYYKVRREIDKYSDLSEFVDYGESGQFDFEKEEIISILEVEWCNLDWFRKSLVQMYIELGSINKVAKKTRIPKTSVSNYLKQSREIIKTNLFKELKLKHG